MLRAVLESIHLLSIIVWVGGMFFAVFCLRPALGVLEPIARLKLMQEVLRRFFDAVTIAIVLMLLTGGGMLAETMRALSTGGAAVALPLAWHVMVVLGLVMVGVFAHVRVVLFGRLRRAVAAQDVPAGASALAGVRFWVLINVVLGALIVVAMKVGPAL
ncbi:MAG: CopD family protein [Burkholderiaceae bacterium]